jgi:uncharacterized protein YbaR (Trm112 family)
MAEEIISKELLDILACPACKNEVELTGYKEGEQGLRCAVCKCIYPIRDGIPVMLIDEAIKEE